MGPGGGRRYKKVRSQKANGVDFLTTHFKKLSPLSPPYFGMAGGVWAASPAVSEKIT